MRQQRITRLKSRSLQAMADYRKALAWRFQGGKKYYSQNWGSVAAKYRWCFIVGCNNSGTTLIQDLLEKSLPVSTLPHEGQRYTNALQRGSRRGYERVWSEFIDELKMSAEDSLSCAPRLLHDWMLEFKSPRESMLIEKTTVNAVRMQWLQKVFPNSYFIGMVRNGYSVVEGINRKGGKSFVRGATHWRKVNEIMLNDAKKINNFMLLKYEDLADKPYESLQVVAKFLEFGSTDLLDIKDMTDVLNNIKNMNAESIERLSAEDSKLIKEHASEMLQYFGY